MFRKSSLVSSNYLNPSSTKYIPGPCSLIFVGKCDLVCILSIKPQWSMPKRNNISANFIERKKGTWFQIKRCEQVSQGVTETSYLKHSSLRQRLPLATSSSCWSKSSQFLQSKKNVETCWEPFPVPPFIPMTNDHHQLPVPKSQKRRRKLLDLDQMNLGPLIWRWCTSRSESFQPVKQTRRRLYLSEQLVAS